VASSLGHHRQQRRLGSLHEADFRPRCTGSLSDSTSKSKPRMMEEQIRRALDDTSKFRVLSFSLNGSAAGDPTNQNSATVDFRVFAQARDIGALMLNKFLRPMMDLIKCAYPSGTFIPIFDKEYQSPFSSTTRHHCPNLI
jgi:hypothetical protein